MPRDRPDLDAFGRPVERSAVPSAAGDAPWAATVAAGAAGPVADAPIARDRPADGSWSAAPAPAPAAGAGNPQAVIALVCGILGFVLAPVVLSVAAIAVGSSGVRRADALPGAPGRTMARVGRGLGWASLVFYGLLIVLAVAYVA